MKLSQVVLIVVVAFVSGMTGYFFGQRSVHELSHPASDVEQIPASQPKTKTAQSNQAAVAKTGDETTIASAPESITSVSNADPLPPEPSVEEVIAEVGRLAGGEANLPEKEEFGREEGLPQSPESVERQTAVADFIELHPRRDDINLMSLRCQAQSCDLVGTFAGSGDEWERLLDDMKSQDWWDYTSTSSQTGSSDGGETKFVLYMSRKGR